MKLKLFSLILLYFLSRIPFIRSYPVYYDSFEYERIADKINLSNFRQTALLSHQPVHTFYLATAAFFKSFFPYLNSGQVLSLISFLSGLFTVIIFYLAIKDIDGENRGFWAGLFLLSFPYFLAVNSNILYEGEFLMFLALALLLGIKPGKKNNMYLTALSGVSYGLSVLIFIGSLFFLPIILIVNIAKKKKPVFNLFIFLLAFSLTAILSDLILFSVIINLADKYLSHASDFTSARGGILIFTARILRNIFLQTSLNLSAIGAAIFFAALIFFLYKKRVYRTYFLVLGIPLMILMQYWHAGLYGRLAVIILFPAAYVLSQIGKNSLSKLLIILLILTTTGKYAKAFLSRPPSYHYLKLINNNPVLNGSAVVTSDYNRFIYERYGSPVFIIRDTPGIYDQLDVFISRQLQNNRIVAVDSQAVFFPNRQFDGDFYHPLTFKKRANEKIQTILKKYPTVSTVKDSGNEEIYFLILNPGESLAIYH